MKVYPVFLRVDGQPCLVVGGGAVGERKVAELLQAGAVVTVVSRELTTGLQDLAAQHAITFRAEDFRPEHLEGMTLVIGATDSPAVNRAVSTAARERRLPVNIVDAPELGSFIVPATVRRGALTLAIGTGGASPALARRLRRQLEDLFGPEYEPYLDILAAVRDKVLARQRHHPGNQQLFTRLVAGPLLPIIRTGDREAARRLLQEELGEVLQSRDLEDILNTVDFSARI